MRPWLALNGAETATKRGTARFSAHFAVMPMKPHDRPSDVAVEEGEVLVDGPDGVAVSLTPSAAEETSRRLFDAAVEAAGDEKQRSETGAAGR